MAFLDTEKAFGSVEWVFLWKGAVQIRFWSSISFYSLGMLYRAPRAKVLTNDGILTRQECPLSLFSLFSPGRMIIAWALFYGMAWHCYSFSEIYTSVARSVWGPSSSQSQDILLSRNPGHG